MKKGPADRSYGIHVAKLAGMPEKLLERADVILKKLESTSEMHAETQKTTKTEPIEELSVSEGDVQLSLFEEPAEKRKAQNRQETVKDRFRIGKNGLDVFNADGCDADGSQMAARIEEGMTNGRDSRTVCRFGRSNCRRRGR